MRILSSAFEAKCLREELADFQLERSVEAVGPPSNNMGGTSLPPLPLVVDQKVRIDWLAFTSPIGIVSLKILVECLFPSVVMSQNDKGMYGYPDSYSLTVDDVDVGIIGFGAKHGKDLVSITGKGCQLWDSCFYPHVLDVLQTAEAKLNRIDLALDFYRGELSYDDCLAAYVVGEFKLPKSPKMPMLSQVASSCDGVNFGRTMYVGSRKGSKMARCYEKGLEIFARLPESVRQQCTDDPGDRVYGPGDFAPDGTIANQWLRVEIEYKAVDVLLPLDMVVLRDKYFIGSYPFCERVLGMSDGLRPKALLSDEAITNEKMVLNARKGYGNAVHTWRKCGYTDKQILDMLDTGFHNQRMVKAGILAKHRAQPDSDIPF
jgi:phage replication initiation protein